MRKKRKARRKSFGHIAKTAGVLAISLNVITGCQATGLFTPDQPGLSAGQQVKTVNVVKIAKQKIGETPEVAAEVVSSFQADILTTTGGTVDQILKRRNDIVQKGDVIVRLTSPDLLLARERAFLAVKSAEEAIVRAKNEWANGKSELQNAIQKKEAEVVALTRSFNKLKNDLDVNLAKKAQVEQAETELNNSQMDLDLIKQRLKAAGSTNPVAQLDVELKSAQLALQQAERSVESLEIKAPIDGILTELPVEAGMTLKGETKAGRIVHIDPITIKAQLNEEAVKLVESKEELAFYVPGSTEKLIGKVSYLAKVMDTQARTYELNLDVENKDLKLKPGMKIRTQLAEEQAQIVTTIPTYSIVKEGENAYVFVYADRTVEKRKVVLGRLNEPNQEVVSGVKEGELVVVSGQTQLKDKENVQLSAAIGQ